MVIEWPTPEKLPELRSDEVHVWAARMDSSHVAPDYYPLELSSDERARAAQFRLDAPRRRFVLARVTLRRLLGTYLNVPPETVVIHIDPNGKPRLGDSHAKADLQFNLAHSGDLALFAIAIGCDVGVDVEQIRPVAHADRIADRYFHPAESRAIASAADEVRDDNFLRCWAGKEAVLKSLGSGVTGSLATFQVPTGVCDRERIELPAKLAGGEMRCWLLPLGPCSGYVGAVAWLGTERQARCFELRIQRSETFN